MHSATRKGPGVPQHFFFPFSLVYLHFESFVSSIKEYNPAHQHVLVPRGYVYLRPVPPPVGPILLAITARKAFGQKSHHFAPNSFNNARCLKHINRRECRNIPCGIIPSACENCEIFAGKRHTPSPLSSETNSVWC